MADESGTEDIARLSGEMERLDGLTKQFGRSLSRTFASGILQGRGFEGMLRSLGERMIELALRASFKPLETGLTSLITTGVKGLFGQGNAGSLFDFSGLTGALGASAPTLVAPVSPSAAAGPNAPPQRAVTVNVAISTADAESFRRSEAQVSATLARAVARGHRNL